MSRIPRAHNPRSVKLFIPGSDTSENTPGSTATLSASFNSEPFYGSEAQGLGSLWLDIGAGLTGSFTLQGTNVPDPERATSADWMAISGPSVNVYGTGLVFAGTAGTTLVTWSGTLVEWFRLVYAHTSGSGQYRAFARTDNSH